MWWGRVTSVTLGGGRGGSVQERHLWQQVANFERLHQLLTSHYNNSNTAYYWVPSLTAQPLLFFFTSGFPRLVEEGGSVQVGSEGGGVIDLRVVTVPPT
jgi:hypothetical protein